MPITLHANGDHLLKRSSSHSHSFQVHNDSACCQVYKRQPWADPETSKGGEWEFFKIGGSQSTTDVYFDEIIEVNL